MRFYTNINGKVIYIGKELNPTEKFEESIEIKEEIINLHLYRLRVSDKYLACFGGKIFFSDKNDDATIFISDWAHEYDFYISIDNNFLCFEGELFTCKNFFDVDHYRGSSSFVKLKTNIKYTYA
jgi:hypothetical protein